MSEPIEEIDNNERKQIEAFKKWRKSLGYDERTDRERDLHQYVVALHAEIGDLENVIHQLRKGLYIYTERS